MRKFSLLVLAVLATSIVACGSNGSTAPPIVIVQGGVAFLKVTDNAGNDTVSRLPNLTIQLKATALDASLSVVTGTWVTHWSSGNAAFATVDANGLVTTVSAGDAWIFASIKPDSTHTFTDSALVRVLAPN